MPHVPSLGLMCLLAIGSTGLHAAPVGSSTPKMFAPGIISGPASEDSLSFTPDGNTVVYDLSNWPSGNHAIMISHRVHGVWSKPRIAPFSGQWKDHDPVLAPDGSYVIYTSNRPAQPGGTPLDDVSPKTGKVTPGRGMHFWRVARHADGSWGTPEPLPAIVNFSTRMYAPSIASNGTLYFQTPDAQHGGAQHLFRAVWHDGHYLKPVRLSLDNFAGYEMDAAIAPDQSFIVYGGDYDNNPKTGLHLYIAFRQGKGWSAPVDLGDTLASYGPWGSHLGPDGHTLYFVGLHPSKISYPRKREQAQRDIAAMQSWGNGLENIWYVSLTSWLKAHVHSHAS